MANFYTHQKKQFGELIRQASSSTEAGATILIPDLQRPFVWTPNQIVRLMDSVVRGWPFGTLLLWKLKDNDIQRFPHDCFYSTVDRTNVNGDGNRVNKQQPPSEYLMVLDGQQRLQSLLLAIGSDEWGIKLNDTDWALELQSRRTRQTNQAHWSKASLCFDTETFLTEYTCKHEKLLSIDFSNVLQWMVIDPVDGQSNYRKPKSYEEPLLRLFDAENQGRYIRFSRIWHAVKEDSQLKEKDFRNQLNTLFEDWKIAVDSREQLLEPLAELMSTLRDIKMSEVSFLQISAYSDIWSQDEYNDAIVNIFTRLNSAGRTLTREEITLAWLKTGWKDAGKTFEKLKEELEGAGLPIDIDELVGQVSFLWSVQMRDGKLLQNRDLLDPAVIRPMASNLSENWSQIQDAILSSMEILQERKIKYGNTNQFTSVHSLVIVWALVYMGKLWGKDHPLRNTDKDDYEMKLKSVIDNFMDRWVFGSQWAGRWSVNFVKNIEGYAAQLAKEWASICNRDRQEDVVNAVKRTTDELLDGIKEDARTGIDLIQASSRSRVSVYRNFLWVWHRLNADRWDMSKIGLKSGRSRVLSADVDHSVAYKLWEKKVNAEWTGTDEDEKKELMALVNKLGNCILLEKTFNISKGKVQLDDFISQVHELKIGTATPQKWADELLLSSPIMKAESSSINEIAKTIMNRDTEMKKELKEFIVGEKKRCDINDSQI